MPRMFSNAIKESDVTFEMQNIKIEKATECVPFAALLLLVVVVAVAVVGFRQGYLLREECRRIQKFISKDKHGQIASVSHQSLHFIRGTEM